MDIGALSCVELSGEAARVLQHRIPVAEGLHRVLMLDWRMYFVIVF